MKCPFPVLEDQGEWLAGPLRLTSRVFVWGFGGWILMLLLALPRVAHAQFNYTTNKGEITITGYTGSGGAVTIPSVIDGLPVTRIGDLAFHDCFNLNSINIPNSVISIGDSAFNNCVNLSRATIPGSITQIGNYAFWYCPSLTNVTIPSSVTNIGVAAFANCSKLMAITVDTLNSSYRSLFGVLFDKSRKTLIQCPAAKAGSYTIPGSVTNVGDYAFDGCGGLLMVSIPDTVETIGRQAFDGCTRLVVVTIGKGINSIGDLAFDYCLGLRGVIFQGNPPSLGSSVFSWDGAIVYYMPGTTGWTWTFGGLRTELWDPQGQFVCTTNGPSQFQWQLTNCTVTIRGYSGPGGVVVIPSTIYALPVTSIGDTAFEYCDNLLSLAIPDGVTNIGNAAFAACDNLTSVTISSTVTNIGYSAFSHCPAMIDIAVDPLNPVYSSLDGVLFDQRQTRLIEFPEGKTGSYRIPDGVVRAAGAFGSCDHLATITIPSSLTDLGTGEFFGCSRLTAITVDALNPAYSSMDGVLFNKNQTTLVEYPPFKDGVYTIPDSVTAIESAAFDGCVLLHDLTLSNHLASIGDAAFIGSGLTNIVIPDSVTLLGNEPFYQCLSLASATIGNGVTRIPFMAFQNCVTLTSVTIGDNVTGIDWAAFSGCGSLTSITIPVTVSAIGPLAFQNCTSLSGIYFWGQAPPQAQDVLLNDNLATVYYLPGSIGWGATFGGRPTAVWAIPNPLILTTSPSFGVQTNGFGFTVSWATNASIVVEAATNLANPVWYPLSTNLLTRGSFYFTDPQWTNYPNRFYHIRSP